MTGKAAARASVAKTNRRAVLTILASGPATLDQIAEQAGIPFQQARTAVLYLQTRDIVLGRGEGRYELWEHVTARMKRTTSEPPRHAELRAPLGRFIA